MSDNIPLSIMNELPTNKSGQVIKINQKRMIIHAWLNYQQQNPCVMRTDIREYVSKLVGVGKTTIYKIMKEFESTGR